MPKNKNKKRNKSSTQIQTASVNTELAQLITTGQADNYEYVNTNPDVDGALARLGYGLYTNKMMADDQVKACVLIKKYGVVVGGYSIQAAVGESEEGFEEAKEIAEFTDYCLKRMKGSIEKLLANIAHAIVPGFSVLEIVWDLIEDGPFAGKVGIKEVKPKPAESFTFELDVYGNVINLIQRMEGTETKISLDKVLLYTFDPQSTGLPMGVSDLRAAYKHWWSKDALMRFRNIAADKFSCPTVLGKYPVHFSKALQNSLAKACRSFTTSNSIIIPEGADITLIEAKGSVVMPYDSSIDHCDKGIARAIFGQVLATGEGSTGSFAQAKIHRGILGIFLSGLRQEIAEEVIKEQLFKRLVAYNYGSSLTPSMVLNIPDEKDIDAYANVIDKFISQGVVNPYEPFVREMFGFPPMPQVLIEEGKKSLETKNSNVEPNNTSEINEENKDVEIDNEGS